MAYFRVWHLIGLLLGMAFLTSPEVAAETEPASKSVRVTLRADWQNPPNTSGSGSVRISEGRIESARPLELRSGQFSMVPSGDTKSVSFSTTGPSSWCGLDLTIDAPSNALVEIDLDGERLATTLMELLQGVVAQSESGRSMRIRRSAADVLRVKLNRPHLIFAPGETAELDIEFNLITAEPRTVSTQLEVSLQAARDGARLIKEENHLQLPTCAAEPLHRTVRLRLPTVEGVFDLVVRAEPEGLQPVKRVVQFVVFNNQAPPSARSAELVTRLVTEIDPAHPNAAGPWYSTSRLKARTTRLGQLLWSGVRHPFAQADRNKESPLLLCRLNVQNPGRPHLVCIDYTDPGNMLLAASVSDQDPQGRWLQLPMASGIRTRENATGASTVTHQFVVWPQTKSPSLSLYLEGVAGATPVHKIRLLELPQGLPSLDVRDHENARRLFGLTIDNPDIWAGWGSSRVIDPGSGLVAEDWRTFFDSMSHLTEYARYSGYNCVQATVIGDGGAVYPSELLESNFCLDSGSLADSAPDPLRKDIVELLLRVCERERLGVVPSIRLDGAMTALNRKHSAVDPQAGGVLLVSREGKNWDGQPGATAKAGRRYDPLNSDVQAAMLEIVREFIERYGSHSNLEALALDLSGNSHCVLPGLEWGYDDQTVARFARETGFQLPAAQSNDPSRFAERYQLLTTTGREQWTAWRCRQVSQFYESVLSELQRVNPRCRLIINLTSLVGTGTDEKGDPSRGARSAEEHLRSKGIDLRNWSPPRDIIVLRPYVPSGSGPESLQLNASRELDNLLAGSATRRGSLCIHEPEVLHFAVNSGPDEKASEGTSEAISVLVTQPGRTTLRRYAQSLAGGDCQAIFEGGPAVPLGQEQLQRDFARVFRSLPASEFQSIETLQPVVVRSHRDSRDNFVYLVNDASYPVETTLSFNCPSQVILNNGATGEKLPVYAIENGIGAKLALEPFQTMYVKLSGPESTIVQCNVTVPPAAERGLKVRFDRLSQAMNVMGRDASRTLDNLPPNGDFEQARDQSDQPARWTIEGDARFALDPEVFHGGTKSLRLAGEPGGIAASESFRPHDGRAMAMNVWLRADRPGLRLRWFLTGGDHDETGYRRYADIRLGTEWEQKQFRVRDLPEGQLSSVKVKFQLLDEGTLWLDEARVCALPISQDEKLAISKSFSAIFKAWRERRLSDFERLSDGYWANYLIESVEGTREKDF